MTILELSGDSTYIELSDAFRFVTGVRLPVSHETEIVIHLEDQDVDIEINALKTMHHIEQEKRSHDIRESVKIMSDNEEPISIEQKDITIDVRANKTELNIEQNKKTKNVRSSL